MIQRERLVRAYGEEVVENLEYLIGYCGEAASIVALGEARFLDDLVLQRASEAILNRIGDTVRNRLPAGLLDEYPGQPWRQIISQRVRTAHMYHTLDYRMIWTTLVDDLPRLKAYIADVILGGE